MAEYSNENTGIVSKNDRKQQDSHPDITGSINVEGVDYFLDGWRRERKAGTGGFYSLKVKRKQPPSGGDDRAKASSDYAKASGGVSRDLDDPLPF